MILPSIFDYIIKHVPRTTIKYQFLHKSYICEFHIVGISMAIIAHIANNFRKRFHISYLDVIRMYPENLRSIRSVV